MEIRVVINNPKTGKSYQKQVDGSFLQGKRIGDKVDGDSIGLTGFELELRGGSDTAGFPMRSDINTSGRRKALLTKGPGVILARKGMKKRKNLRGNTMSEFIAQANLKIIKAGSGDVEDLLGIKKEEPAAAPAEAPAQ